MNKWAAHQEVLGLGCNLYGGEGGADGVLRAVRHGRLAEGG